MPPKKQPPATVDDIEIIVPAVKTPCARGVNPRARGVNPRARTANTRESAANVPTAVSATPVNADDNGAITASTCRDMFCGLSDATVQFVLRDLRDEFMDAIDAVNDVVDDVRTIAPPPALIMHAWRCCPVERVRVVLLGQDPYIREGQAMGLAFACGAGGVPPSLRAIHSCMNNQWCACPLPPAGDNNDGKPSKAWSSDVSHWSDSGVLLLNASLTTVLGTSNAHATCWRAYTTALIAKMSAELPPGLVFIALGADAQRVCANVDTSRHRVLSWGHPSPLNPANRDKTSPLHFSKCTVFTETVKLHPTVNWSANQSMYTDARELAMLLQKLDADETSHRYVYVFTDGGAVGNGTDRCCASWAICICDGEHAQVRSGLVPAPASNNRGELTAILTALTWIYCDYMRADAGVSTRYTIVSDSEYSIKSVSTWAASWLTKPKRLATVKNPDLIMPAMHMYTRLRDNVRFLHVNSHKNAPVRGTREWALWCGNDICDRECEAVIAANPARTRAW